METADIEELRHQISRLVEEAREFNFRRDASIVEYVRICIRFCTNYSTLIQHGGVLQMVQTSEFTEEEKLYLLAAIAGRDECN